LTGHRSGHLRSGSDRVEQTHGAQVPDDDGSSPRLLVIDLLQVTKRGSIPLACD